MYKIVHGVPTNAGLNCYGRKNLAAYLRFMPEESTRNNKRPTARRINCKFCGKDRAMYTCLACGEWFCMSPPFDLIIPESDPQKKFRNTGIFCWHRIHGYNNWSELGSK